MAKKIKLFTLTLIMSALALPTVYANELLEQQMLAHVEKIVVVDSITADREAFLNAYLLHPSTGRVLPARDVGRMLTGTSFPRNFKGTPFTGFTNEFNDYMIWAQEDTTGYLRLAESVRLIDGSWSTPEFTSPVLNNGDEDEDETVFANAAFPFMADDGQTLYYASDNENSLGGYDIFVATKDPSDGEFLIPGNLGMPFNSPFDDYMMVLDRQTGVGWWATDRNQLDDQITIYVYALSDQRENVDPDDELLHAYATLEGWRDLLDESQLAEVQKLKKEIKANIRADKKAEEFELRMPGNRTYTNFSDFRNQRAAQQMRSYLQLQKKVDSMRSNLYSLRVKYHLSAGDKQVGQEIQTLEEQLRSTEQNLKSTLSEVYRLELN